MSEYWKAPPEKREAVNYRFPRDLKANLQAAQELFRVLAVLEGSDPEAVTATYTAERLLRVSLDGLWAQVGAPAGLQGMPRNAEEWEKLKKSLTKRQPKR